MKKTGIFLMAFFLVGNVSAVFGQRYNPYSPFVVPGVAAPEQQRFQDTHQHEANYFSNAYGVTAYRGDTRYYLYERDYLTRPYLTEYRKGFLQDNYFINPYGTIPRRWYDSQLGEQMGGGAGRGYEVSGMLSSPYEDSYLRQRQKDQAEGSVRQNYSSDSDYTTVPYGLDPKKWYESPVSAQGTATRPHDPPKSLSSPFSAKEASSLSSSETLTSPFEKVVQPSARRSKPSEEYTLELTPPSLR